MMELSQIFIYPVKSLGGISLDNCLVTGRGLQYDRWWMLIDDDNQFISQRTHPKLSLFQTEIKNESLIVYRKGESVDCLTLDLHPRSGLEVRVRIWDDDCTAWLVSEAANSWFSGKLNRSVRLVYMPEEVKRFVDPDYALNEDTTGFSDGFPVLLIGQSSLDDLNQRLAQGVSMDRFRPNLVFSGGQPFEEDKFRTVQVDEVKFAVVKPCARCVMTTIDQVTGSVGKEPLQTLSAYRTINSKVLFGQNLLVLNGGILIKGHLFLTDK